MKLEFVKMQGIGNDFILVDDRDMHIAKKTGYENLSAGLCDRHFGIGADGLIVLQDSKSFDIRFLIFNSDGSRAQMCGNGMRCAARFLYEEKIISSGTMKVETDAGLVIPQVLLDENNHVVSVSVDMGEPVLEPQKIPFLHDGDRALNVRLDVDGQSFEVTCVSMGNPHAVIFVEDFEQIDPAETGPLIERHPKFPEKTNVEFIRSAEPGLLEMKVWERGAGITLACGTGACAALVAACLTGRSDRQSVVRLDGGDLDIFWDPDTGHVIKTGPAEIVFKGHVSI